MMIVQIAGRLGREPEVRFTPSGQKVTKLAVAVNVFEGGKEETVWVNVSVWGERFDKMISFLKKGSSVIVVGEMSRPRPYTDKEGKTQVSVDMTADILKFTPSSADPSKQDNAGMQNNQSTFKQQAQPTSNQNMNYGANSYSAQSTPSYGQGNSSSFADSQDDQLPF